MIPVLLYQPACLFSPRGENAHTCSGGLQKRPYFLFGQGSIESKRSSSVCERGLAVILKSKVLRGGMRTLT